MNSTESRLRDYLQHKADIVPDGATPPDLTLSPKSRHTWPVLVAAAAIAAVLIGTVPVLLRISDKEPAPPVVAGSLTGKGPKPVTPYIIYSNGPRTLHDGATEVPLPTGRTKVRLVGRTGQRWLVRVQTDKRDGGLESIRHALLDRAGQLVPVGPAGSQWASLSPDRTRAVMVEPAPDIKAGGPDRRLVVVDLSTRQEVASLPGPFDSIQLHGWNRDGIWYTDMRRVAESIQENTYVWRPGQSEPRKLELPGRITSVLGSTNRMLLTTSAEGSVCDVVVELEAAGTVRTIRRNCMTNPHMSRYPAMSVDGSMVLIPSDRFAVNVETGEKVRLPKLPGTYFGTTVLAEDEENFLMTTDSYPNARPQTPGPMTRPPTKEESVVLRIVYRCNGRSGDCQEVMRTTLPHAVELMHP